MGSLHQSLRTNRHRSLGRSAHDALRGSDKTPFGVRRQFSSIELLSLKGGRCSPPSSSEYAPIRAQSKQEGGCVGSACACGWGTTPTPAACAAIAQSPFCPTHSMTIRLLDGGPEPQPTQQVCVKAPRPDRPRRTTISDVRSCPSHGAPPRRKLLPKLANVGLVMEAVPMTWVTRSSSIESGCSAMPMAIAGVRHSKVPSDTLSLRLRWV